MLSPWHIYSKNKERKIFCHGWGISTDFRIKRRRNSRLQPEEREKAKWILASDLNSIVASYLPQPFEDWLLVKVVFLASGHVDGKYLKDLLDVGRMDRGLWRGWIEKKSWVNLPMRISEGTCLKRRGTMPRPLESERIEFAAFTLPLLMPVQSFPIQIYSNLK